MPGFQVSGRPADTPSIDHSEFLTTSEAILNLREPLTHLLRRLSSPEDAVTRAGQFMALTRYPALSHFATAVWHGSNLRGLAYAGQRNAFGIPVGAVYLGAEDHGDNGVIAGESDRPSLIRLAISNLLASSAVHTILVRDQALGLAFTARTDLSTKIERQAVRSILPLGNSFEAFLHGLGKHTRRNLMYYRRRALARGCGWVEQLSQRQLDTAIETLLRHQRTSSHSRHSIAARCEILRGKPIPLWSGLRAAGGEWLALSGVWQEGERAFMTFQLNHDAEEYRRASLSTVIRSCLIESLIARGVRELVFLGGCRGILEPFCQPVTSELVTIEKRGPMPAFRRALLAALYGRGASLARCGHRCHGPPRLGPVRPSRARKAARSRRVRA